jgi:hypothetical protein
MATTMAIFRRNSEMPSTMVEHFTSIWRGVRGDEVGLAYPPKSFARTAK